MSIYVYVPGCTLLDVPVIRANLRPVVGYRTILQLLQPRTALLMKNFVKAHFST